SAAPLFAWCFDHGRMHHFDGPPWCTAAWAPLDATTEAEAQDETARRWGDAQFFHQLPAEQQLALIDQPQENR
ncbi:hypothetical protein KBZ21_45310, partial [Streptomyces sp. A73]|nr:hypothetical protein [Streptomyces sp. A73]